MSASLRRLALRRVANAVAVSALFALNAASASAAAKTWTGSAGDTDWATPANWGGTTPLTGDSLIFTSVNASPSTTLTNTLTNSGFNIVGISFNAGAPAYTMTGNTFTLTGGVTNNSGSVQTFSNTGGLTSSAGTETVTVSSIGGVNITTGLANTNAANQTLSVVGAGGLLTLSSYDLAGTGSAVRTNIINGNGNVTINGPVLATNAATSSLQYIGVGTLTLKGAVASTYTGATVVNSGTEVLDFANLATPTDLINNSSPLTLAGGVLVVKGQTGAAATSQTFGTLTINAGGTGSSGTNGGSGSSGITINPNGGAGTTLTFGGLTRGGGVLNIDLSAGGTLATSNSVIANTGVLGYATVKDASGVGFATVIGGTVTRLTGQTALSAASTSSGTTDFIASGNVALPAANFSVNTLTIDTSGGDGSLDLGGSGDVLTLAKRGIVMTGSGNYAINNGVVGDGFHELTINQMGTGALTINGTIFNTVNNALTKGGPGTLNLTSANTYGGGTNINAGTFNLSGSIATTGGGFFVGNAGTFNEASTGQLTGTAKLTNKGITNLNGTNTFSGSTVIAAGLLKFGTLTSMPATGTVTVSGLRMFPPVLAVNVGGPGEFTAGTVGSPTNGTIVGLLSQTSSTAATAATTGGLGSQAGSFVVFSSYSALGIDTTNAPGGVFTYSNSLNEPGSAFGTGLTKLGTGTLALTSATVNNYFGNTNINGGTLSVNATINSSQVTFTGGNFQYGGTNTQDLSGKLRFSTSAISLDTNGNNVAFSNGIDGTNTGGLTKTGAGQITLNGASGYTGLTTIAGGTLLVNNADIAGVSGALGNGGDITFTGGTLKFNAAQDYSSRIKNSTSAVTLDIPTNAPVFKSPLDSSNTGGLTKLGASTLYLGSANAYSGTTTISAGTIQLGYYSASTTTLATGSLPVGSPIVDNGNLAINRSNAVAQGTDFSAAPITGTGTLSHIAYGTTTLTAANTYTGGTIVSDGKITGNSASFGSGDIATSGNGVVDYTQGGPGTANNNITGTGKVTFGGTASSPNGSGGTITYTGVDSAAGGTTVSTSRVELSHAGGGALSGPVTAASGGVVGLASSNQLTTGANVTLLGSGILAAEGNSDGTGAKGGSVTPTTGAGTLQIGSATTAATATLDFGDASGTAGNVLAFTDSSGLSWNGTLNIINYTGSVDQLYIGTTGSGLTPTQLAKIKFNGAGIAAQLGNGEVVAMAAAPEPSGWASMIIGMGVLGSVIARRRKATLSAQAV